MGQLALDLHAVAPPSLANFVAGGNEEALACLDGLAAGARTQRFVYLWGAPGSGRSHLLAALAGERVLGPMSPLDDFAGTSSTRTEATSPTLQPAALRGDSPTAGPSDGSTALVAAADDVHRFDAQRQEALFHLFNRVLARPDGALVCTGDRPPLALPLRDDLRTRLGWGLVIELRLLDDAHKAAAIRRAADARGVTLSSDFIPWLLTHRSRDIRELLALFDALDRFAFERKRPITLPLLREWLSQRGDDLERTDSAGKIL